MRVILRLYISFLLPLPLGAPSQPKQPISATSNGSAPLSRPRPTLARGLPCLQGNSRSSSMTVGGRGPARGTVAEPPVSTQQLLQILPQGKDSRGEPSQPSLTSRLLALDPPRMPQSSAWVRGAQAPVRLGSQRTGAAPSSSQPARGRARLPSLRSSSLESEAVPVGEPASSSRSSTPRPPPIAPHVAAIASSSSSTSASSSSSPPKGPKEVSELFTKRVLNPSLLSSRGPSALVNTMRVLEVSECPPRERKRTPTPSLSPVQLRPMPNLQPQAGGLVSPTSSSPSRILTLQGDTRVRVEGTEGMKGKEGKRVGINRMVEVHESLHGPRSPPPLLGKTALSRRKTKDLQDEDDEKPFYDSSLKEALSFMRPGKFGGPKHSAKARTHSYKKEDSFSDVHPSIKREDPESPRVKGKPSAYYSGSPIFSFEPESYVLTGFQFKGKSYLFGSEPPSGFIKQINELEQGLSPMFKNEYANYDPRRALFGGYNEADFKANPLFALGRIPLVSHVAWRIKEIKSELKYAKKKLRNTQDSSEYFGWTQEGSTAKFYVDQISALQIPPIDKERVQGETDEYKKEVEMFAAQMMSFFKALRQNRELLSAFSSATRQDLDSFKKSVQDTLTRRLLLLSPPECFKVFEKDIEVLTQAALEEYDSPHHMYTALLKTESAPYLLGIASFLGMHTENGDSEMSDILTIDAHPPTRFFHNPLHQIEDPDEMHGETHPRELHFQASKAGSEGAFDPLIRFFGHRTGPLQREEAGVVLVEFLSALASKYTSRGEKEMNEYLHRVREML